ncbi:hypothetical protein LAZ67_12000078 [Cordylochernes scorpioides]|uniref:RNA-directed DNA polymerase n=1 Tax=Cordylochernes scorpioides TaxID=51811 RepID=A0ABY6L444_9ARAC|nr:hypothetical protein LAZ67_12000078 [Cordylochernes scorpioides]
MTETEVEYFADALTDMQPHCDDLVSRLTDAIRGLAMPRAEEALIPPFDGSYAANNFIQQLERTSEGLQDDATLQARLRTLLKGEPLSLYNELNLASLPYSQAKQTLIDLYPGKSEVTFTKFLTFKLNNQIQLGEYYRQKITMGLQLGLTNPIIVEALTEGLQANDQRLMRAVAPKTLNEWYSTMNRIKGTNSLPTPSEQFQGVSNTSAFHRNTGTPSRERNYNHFSTDSTPRYPSSARKPPSPCKYCQGDHWNNECSMNRRPYRQQAYHNQPTALYSPPEQNGAHNLPVPAPSKNLSNPLKLYPCHILINSISTQINSIGYTFLTTTIGKITKSIKFYIIDNLLPFGILSLNSISQFCLTLNLYNHSIYQCDAPLSKKWYHITYVTPCNNGESDHNPPNVGHLKNIPNSHSPLLQGKYVHPIPCPITLTKTSTNYDKNAPSQTLDHLPHLYLLPPLYPSEHQCKNFNDSCNLCVRNDIPLTFMNIIKNYSNIFSTNKYNIPKLKIPPINIRTNSDKIIALRPYRTSLSDQREIQEQVGKMLEYDIIEPSFSPYSSPVTLVTKKDKTKRFCVDYRRLNEIIFPDVHPLPLIENILDKLANAKIYSRADFSSAYWSIEISPPDRNLLSFVTLEGQYNFKRLPYGIKIGPQVYERAVSQILQRNRLGFIAHYFDDFIIFSNSIEEHLDHLQQFFDMCNRENFRLNYNKCDFFKTTIEFLGYTISSGIYTPLVKNLDVINAIKVPTSVKSLQSFIGSINVYNKFIKDHARIRNPLNNLLKKGTSWHWDAKCQHSFDTLKECLTTKPVLHLFKEGLPCQLFCDASLQGIAGILKQQHPDGTLHPVQYYSRTLRPHEKNYTITELECLAVIDSVEKFRIYLAGVRFTIFTDHHALQWLKTIKNPTGRLFRWSLKMSAYEYDIKYIKGKTQYEADLLSRNPLCGFLTTTQIIEKQPQLPPSTLIKTNIDGLHTIRRKGIVKIIVPPSLQHTLINKVHLEYNHPGVSQMIRLISTQYTWCGMTKSIVKYNRSCPTCQLIKKPKGPLYGRLERPPIALQPYDMLSIDTISGFSKYGNSKSYLHVIVDHLSRYTWTFPSKSTNIITYIQCLKKVLQCGRPKRLLSDRAPAFTSPKFRRFLIKNGIQPLLTTANNPQANGLCERLNATLTGKLRLLNLENPGTSWTKLIKIVTNKYNDTPHTITGFPPVFLMYNIIPSDLNNHVNPYPNIIESRKLAIQRTNDRHDKEKIKYDNKHKNPHFDTGDLVLVKAYHHPNSGKLVPYFTGPYKITEIISDNVVRINRPNRITVGLLGYHSLHVIPPTKPSSPGTHSVVYFKKKQGFNIDSVTKKYLYSLKCNNFVHPAQHGFTQEKSTISALQEITKLSLLKRETENTAIVTVDISGAFDNAWHPAILQQLDKANIYFPEVLIKIINSYFEDRSVEFKYTNVKCIKKIDKGCPQGGIISPILWNILLNDFNLSFNESFARVIAFADDVIFVVWSSNIYDLQYNITKCLIKIKACCEKVKLSLSPNKTGILYLHNYEKLPINFDGKIIQPSETVKILGVIFKNHRQRNKINFGTHVDNIIMKATKLKNILFSLCARTWGIDTRRRLILYKAMIRSTISYATNIWFPFITAAKRSKLNSIQYQILIRCIHAYRTSSSYITHILAKTPLLSDYLELLQTKYNMTNYLTDLTLKKTLQKELNKLYLDLKFKFYLSQSNELFKKFFPIAVPNFISSDKFTTLFLTGKGPFLSFLFKLNAINDPTCECRLDVESPEHLLLSCPLTNQIVCRYFETLPNSLCVYTLSYENFVKDNTINRLAIRTTEHSSTGFTPAKLVFGHELRLPQPFQVAGQSPVSEDLIAQTAAFYERELTEEVEKIREVVRQTYLNEQEEAWIKFENKRLRTFNNGDLVLVERMHETKGRHKFEPRYGGPYEVLRRAGDTVYLLKNLETGNLDKYHIDRLKQYHIPIRIFPTEEEETSDGNSSQGSSDEDHWIHLTGPAYLPNRSVKVVVPQGVTTRANSEVMRRGEVDRQKEGSNESSTTRGKDGVERTYHKEGLLLKAKEESGRVVYIPMNDVSQDVLESEMKNLLSSLFPNDCQSSDTNYHKLIRDKSYTFSNDKIIYFDNIQICSIIKKLKNGKAPGIDHISNQMIKTAVHHISPVLTKLFNACMGLNYYPEAWRKSAVMIIKKPNKENYKDPKAYRPISLSSNLGKIFESLIHIELLNHINSNNVMHTAQHGFTQEKSTISALQEITKLSLLKRETENTAIVTVDISGAFDNAWHPAILQQLDKANFPAVLIKIINSYFEDRSVEFKYTNVKCIKKINKGCPQGGIISPILWNILLNDFNLSFNESFARVIAFADDVTFVVWSSNIYDLQYNITKCLIKIKAWCEKVKLSLSPNKTGILYLHNYEKLPINFDGKIIQPSETVKILGVIFKNHRQRNKINFGTHVDNIIMKATKLKNILFSLCARTWGIDTRRRLILYKAMIRSTISYASNIWFPFITAAKRSKLNSIQYQILIRCIHAYRTSSSYITHILAKTPLLSDYLELLQTKYNMTNSLTDRTLKKPLQNELNKLYLDLKFKFYLSQSNELFKKFFPIAVPNFISSDKFTTLFLTGKGPFLSFLFKLNAINDPTCECRLDVESPEHLLLSCPLTNQIGDMCMTEVTCFAANTSFKFILGAVYIHPGASMQDIGMLLWQGLGPYIHNSQYVPPFVQVDSSIPILLCGDFNKNVKPDNSFLKFMKNTYNLDCISNVSKSTTLKGTIIDLTFARHITAETLPFISYFSYHRPILNKITQIGIS